jgi:hypothetical protein
MFRLRACLPARAGRESAAASKTPITSLPEELQTHWSNRAKNGTVPLGLQDDYELLATRGDALGSLFQQLALHDRQKSPLVSRNQSILAHGFDRVGEKVYNQLWAASLRLAALAESDLPVFPHLRLQNQ